MEKSLFPAKPYVTLEDPDTRRYALEYPRGFLAAYPNGAVFDEVQRTPELFSYLQGILKEVMELPWKVGNNWQRRVFLNRNSRTHGSLTQKHR